MLHNAVLARAIHRLQHHQQRIGFAGIKHLLKLFQQLNALLQLVHGFLLAVLVQLAQIARIIVG